MEDKPTTSVSVEDKALQRRGKGLIQDVQDARRIYDPVLEKEWGLKYRNHSSSHMRTAYKTYAEARHDPFNKRPDWTDQIIRRIAREFTAQGITAEEEFARLDVTHDGTLERAEVRRMFLKALPSLGELELAAIFETLDEDRSNEISCEELTHMFWKKGARIAKSSPAASPASDGSNAETDGVQEHRTPVHRVKRIPPAQVEGWDHLQGKNQFNREADLLKHRELEMFKRIGTDLCLSPRKVAHVPGQCPKYQQFGGGSDTNRFREHQWRKDVGVVGGTSSDAIASTVPDPGGLACKPGYHIELAKHSPHLASPDKRRAMRSPRTIL